MSSGANEMGLRGFPYPLLGMPQTAFPTALDLDENQAIILEHDQIDLGPGAAVVALQDFIAPNQQRLAPLFCRSDLTVEDGFCKAGAALLAPPLPDSLLPL